MTFDIFYTVKGPGGIAETPNKARNIEALDFPDILNQLANSIPTKLNLDLEIIGVRIVRTDIEITLDMPRLQNQSLGF